MQDLDRRFLLGGLAGAAGVSALAAMAKAGPLNPPAGAVASTGKTLTDVEPRVPLSQATTPGDGAAVFVITQPGSYYLTGNVATPGGSVGIRVAMAAGVPAGARVSIDLMGFEIAGGQRGILAGGVGPVVSVRNGHIRNTSSNGVELWTGVGGTRINAELENLVVTNAGGNGFVVTGGTVRRCTVDTAALTGISGANGTVIEECLVINATNGAFNGDSGVGVVIRNCTAAQCSGTGAALAGFGVVEGCAFYNVGLANTSLFRAGIRSTGRAIIRNNWIEGAPVGIETTASRSLVVGNTVGTAAVAPFVLAANTLYGPIVNLSSVATPSVNGSSAAGVLTSADPNANFVR